MQILQLLGQRTSAKGRPFEKLKQEEVSSALSFELRRSLARSSGLPLFQFPLNLHSDVTHHLPPPMSLRILSSRSHVPLEVSSSIAKGGDEDGRWVELGDVVEMDGVVCSRTRTKSQNELSYECQEAKDLPKM